MTCELRRRHPCMIPLITVSKILMKGIGQLDFALMDLIWLPDARNLVTLDQTPPAYFANIAVSLALSMMTSILSPMTLI